MISMFRWCGRVLHETFIYIFLKKMLGTIEFETIAANVDSVD